MGIKNLFIRKVEPVVQIENKSYSITHDGVMKAIKALEKKVEEVEEKQGITLVKMRDTIDLYKELSLDTNPIPPKNGINYHYKGLLSSIRDCIRELNEIGTKEESHTK